MATCPHARLITHGPDVGLPRGQMGNSEVGHTNIGAGRVVAMDLGQIDLAIEDGSFFENAAILEFAKTLRGTGGVAHLIGLTSKGGVHAHQTHMLAAAKLLTDQGIPVAVHVITDGRDVAPTSAFHDILEVEKGLPDGARIVSVSGRYYALDRDNRWDRVEKAYRAMVLGDADALSDAREGIATCYDLDQTDEFIEPFVIEGYKGMAEDDGVFFLNFRADRAREILSAIGDPAFDGFKVGPRPALAGMLGMVDYSRRHMEFMTAAYPKKEVVNTLGSWVAQKGLRQMRLAETEKYPHVTFFLNGGRETAEVGEARYMAQSPKVATYDLQPEMSEPEVARELVRAIEERFDLIVVNFANPDMVGHTGDLKAAIAACEAVDEGLGLALDALEAVGGAMIVTADHGNCETMIDPVTGGPHTAHTVNLVPVAVVGAPAGSKLRDGRLADLAPTVLDLMGLDLPPEMTGVSLLVS
jgi:2,3-bisphosphoglycerate-independent phosphoglycerate mutase